MNKNLLLLILLVSAFSLRAQVNIQEMYDLNRGHMTTTLEMFKPDKWGSTFFFNDIYHSNNIAPTEYYTEISRAINFWQNSKLGGLSLHVEWNGGCGLIPPSQLTNFWSGYPIKNVWLYGVEYTLHSADFSKTLTLQAMYKDIRGGKSDIPLQLTVVWGISNLFGLQGLTFSGYADFWWEENLWINNETTNTVFMTEPQIWYNVGRLFGCGNLNVGGEVEISNNFSGKVNSMEQGWEVNPCFGVKWNF